MRDIARKVSGLLKKIYGYGIMICLLSGGLTFFAFLAAIIIGGEMATAITVFVYKSLFPVIIYTSTVMVMIGLLSMYLAGEKALTPGGKKHKVSN